MDKPEDITRGEAYHNHWIRKVKQQSPSHLLASHCHWPRVAADWGLELKSMINAAMPDPLHACLIADDAMLNAVPS